MFLSGDVTNNLENMCEHLMSILCGLQYQNTSVNKTIFETSSTTERIFVGLQLLDLLKILKQVLLTKVFFTRKLIYYTYLYLKIIFIYTYQKENRKSRVISKPVILAEQTVCYVFIRRLLLNIEKILIFHLLHNSLVIIFQGLITITIYGY